MKVCIVGASGKLGQYTVQHALDRGYEVVGVCREQSVQKLDAFKGHMTVIPGATDDREVIKRAVAGCDGVAHGAGPARRAWVLDGNGQTAMSHESSEPGTHRSLSGLTRRTLMRRSAWVQGQLGQAFLNSAYVTAVSVSFILLFAVPAAFGFARLRLPLPAVLGLAILAPLMIPSEVILVPLFVMFRTLGLLNTLEGLITLEVAGGAAFATVVLTTFFRGVPRELEDAARIDGAGSVQVLRYVILPLAGPGIAAVAVFQSVFVWNDYFAPLIVIQKPSLFTVQLAIGNFSNFYTTDESLLFAGLALAMMPPLVVFAVLQRSFIQGMTLGALRD